MKRLFNWTLNLVAAVSVIVIIWQFTHKRWGREGQGGKGPAIGSKVRLGNLRLSARGPSAILALSTSCPFCQSSAGFYGALSSAAGRRGVQVVAAFSEDAATYGPFLPRLGLNQGPAVGQVDLRSLGVKVTPTVLLVDENWIVRKTWVGKLDHAQEREVFDALGLKYAPSQEESSSSTPSDSFVISARALKEMLSDPDFVVVDSRDRLQFDRAHIKNALNIPLDEFPTRAPHEVPGDRTIAVVCPETSGSAAAQHEEGIPTMCDMAKTVVVQWAGFGNAKFIAGDLRALQAQGLAIEGNPTY